MEIIKKIIIRNKILLLLFGLLYFFILWMGGLIMCGLGEWTRVFFYINFSPVIVIIPEKSVFILLSIFYWPLVAMCTSFRIGRPISAFLLILHYICLPNIFAPGDWSQIIYVWESIAPIAISWIFLYLIGQIYFWLCIFYSKNK